MKNLLTISIATLCIIVIGCNQKPSTKKPIPGESNNQTELLNKKDFKNDLNVIPSQLLEFVKAKLPEMQIPTTGDYINGWESFKKGSILPFYCLGDYNGDNLKDHCLLLIKDSTQLSLYSFLTLDNSYQIILIDTIARLTKGIEVVIYTEPKGEWELVEETISVPFDGISIDLIEESNSWSYYWKNDRFVKFFYD